MKRPISVVGLGLAGACTAWRLWRRGVPFRILDSGRPGSSHVAAGLIHAVTGRNCAVAEDFASRREEAEWFYRGCEQMLGKQFWHPMEVVRLLSEADAEKKRRKFESGPAAVWVEQITKDDRWPQDVVVLLRGGARLDVALFLQSTREFFQTQGYYEQREVHGASAGETMIFCEGSQGLLRGHPVAWRHRCARGEILTVYSPSWKQTRMVTGRGWLVPVGQDVYKVGATYDWDGLQLGPTEEGLEKLRKMADELGGAEYEILAHDAGVRPILRQSQPVAGQVAEGVYVLNGLGSKGSLHAPWAAERLVRSIIEGIPLESSLSVGEYFAKLPPSA